MPKTNHNRQFVDERDYSVPAGDWACGKKGARHQRRGCKVGVNRVNRTRQNRIVKAMAAGDENVMLPLPKQETAVKSAHDYNGKATYVRY